MKARGSQSEQHGICVLGMSSTSDPIKASRSGDRMRYPWPPDGDNLAARRCCPSLVSRPAVHPALPGGGQRRDADHLPGGADECAAAVTGVDRRAGLDRTGQGRRRRALGGRLGTARPVAEMIPSVTLPDSPSGLPTASTTSPAGALAESPNRAGCDHGRRYRCQAPATCPFCHSHQLSSLVVHPYAGCAPASPSMAGPS